MVLLVVDTQKALVNDELYNCNEFIDNIQLLIKKARENNVEVIYVVHDDGVGSGLTKGTDGFEIFEKFKPLSNEKVFVKIVNSAFKDTGLVEYLMKKVTIQYPVKYILIFRQNRENKISVSSSF